MDHDAVVLDWKQNAESHDNENYQFFRSLKFQRYGFTLDKLVADLHKHAFQIVDCTR